MHITSLPSKYGIGVMGEETKRFIRRIKDMGFSYWQVLPLCPTDFYGSPYASPAAFALSPLLIDPDTLKMMAMCRKTTLHEAYITARLTRRTTNLPQKAAGSF